jgi:hypothetical protein
VKHRRRRTASIYVLHESGRGGTASFLEADLKTLLPRKLNFTSSEKVIELVERTGALRNLETRQALEHGIANGRGGVFLMLSHEQYRTLAG